jgi:hypothetical protein
MWKPGGHQQTVMAVKQHWRCGQCEHFKPAYVSADGKPDPHLSEFIHKNPKGNDPEHIVPGTSQDIRRCYLHWTRPGSKEHGVCANAAIVNHSDLAMDEQGNPKTCVHSH